jgi:nuclear GTP-binding protein
VWQYITLMKRIYLIDCPGVVPPSSNDTEQDILLRGVVRVENVENPEQYIAAVLEKVKTHRIERTYDIRGFSTPLDFLETLARKGGRLLKGGEADVEGVAKMVLNDFLRGKIPWFTAPPTAEGEEVKGVEGRDGRLGEMSRKRKRVDDESDPGEGNLKSGDTTLEADNEFEGFDTDEEGVGFEGDQDEESEEDEVSDDLDSDSESTEIST